MKTFVVFIFVFLLASSFNTFASGKLDEDTREYLASIPWKKTGDEWEKTFPLDSSRVAIFKIQNSDDMLMFSITKPCDYSPGEVGTIFWIGDATEGTSRNCPMVMFEKGEKESSVHVLQGLKEFLCPLPKEILKIADSNLFCNT